MPSIVYINDPSNNTWQLTVNDNGWLETTSVATMTPAPVIIADPILGQCWQIQAGDGGSITATTIPPTSFQTIILQAPLGSLWQLGVSGEDLITFPAGSGSGGLLPPKIIWPSGGSNALQMTNWPRYVPAPLTGSGQVASFKVFRPANKFSGGQSENIYSRTDQFWEAHMEYVPSADSTAGAGMPTWLRFMQYALMGGNFDFYPSGASPQFTTYLLDVKDWNAAYHQMGRYLFPLRFRLYVAP